MTQAQVYGYLSSWKMAHPEYTNTQLVNKWNATFNLLPLHLGGFTLQLPGQLAHVPADLGG